MRLYPGGKGPLFMGVILGAAGAGAVEAEAPDFGPPATCVELAAAVAAPAMDSSC